MTTIAAAADPTPARPRATSICRSCRLDTDLDGACNPRNWFCRPEQVGPELQRLERLLQFSRRRPRSWAVAIVGREDSLRVWVYGLAIAVAGWDCGCAAVRLLDVLPGIDAGRNGNRALLQELVAHGTAPQPGAARAA